MESILFGRSRLGFRAVASDEESSTEDDSLFVPNKRKRYCYCGATFFMVVGLVVMSAASGAYAAVRFTGETSKILPFEQLGLDGYPVPSGDIATHMIWNTTFSHFPLNNSNSQWKLLYPNGQGHVQHPILAPDTSTIAVYHQLHCLQMVENYYISKTEHVKAQVRSHTHPESGKRLGFPAHIAHCFDYLRQAITCAADSNLEPVDPTLYGANTAIPKTCHDISKVAQWAEQWRSPIVPSLEFDQRLEQIKGWEESVY